MSKYRAGVLFGEELEALLKDAKDNQFALPAVNTTGTNTINATLEAAAKVNSPVIIQFSNGGAQFIAGFWIAPSLAAAAAPTHVPLPVGVTRAIPLTRPAELAPVTWKPKKMLPAASAVSGVLMNTEPSNAAEAALYVAAP